MDMHQIGTGEQGLVQSPIVTLQRPAEPSRPDVAAAASTEPPAPRRAVAPRSVWWLVALLIAALVGLSVFSVSEAVRLSSGKKVLAEARAQVVSMGAANRSLQTRLDQLNGRIGDLTRENRQLGSGLKQCQKALEMDEQFIQAAMEAGDAIQRGDAAAARAATKRADAIGREIDSSNIVGQCQAQS
jgi:hypothetical protein